MKSPLILAFTHCAVATIAVIAAYFFLPGYLGEPGNVANTTHQTGLNPAPAPLQRPPPVQEPVSVETDDSIFGQQYAAHQLAAQSNPQELLGLLDQYLAASDPFLNGNLALVFLERLIEIDVYTALDYAESARVPPQRRQLLLSSLYTSWARYDPQAMSESFASIQDMQTRFQIGARLLQDPVFLASGYESDIVRILGPQGEALLQHTANLNKSPEQRFREALNSQGMRRSHEISQALAHWYRADPDAALGVLDSLNATELQAALSVIVTQPGRREFLEGYELVQQYAPDNLQLLGMTLSLMVATDPDQGLPYLERHYEETGNVGLISQAIMGWASSDLQAALEYTNTLPAHVRANIEPALSHFYVRENPTAAMQWARASNNAQLMQSVASRLAHTNLSAAEQWLDEAENPDIATTLLRDIAQQKSQLGMQQAMNWLDNYREQPGYSQAVSVLLSTFSQADPEESASYLKAFAESNEYAQAFRGVATTWAYTDADAARRWVRSLPEGNNRYQATTGLVQTLMNSDPDAALDLVKEIPDEQASGLRYMIATRLYMSNGDIESAIRRSGLENQDAEAFRQNPPGRGQVMHALPSATIITGSN